jgi:hypothetical protein
MRAFVMIACMFFALSVFADDNCYKNLRGETICKNGQTAVAANPHTGNVAVAQKNSNGVTTTQTSKGGEAKTKNGMGVAQGAGGETCAKGKYHEGCAKR